MLEHYRVLDGVTEGYEFGKQSPQTQLYDGMNDNVRPTELTLSRLTADPSQHRQGNL